MFRNSQSGLSMVELLLAVALLSLVAATLVELPRVTHDTWTLAAHRSELQSNARLGLDFIVREVRQAKAIVAVSGAGDTDGQLRYLDSDSVEHVFDRSFDSGLGRQVLTLDGSAVADELQSFEVIGLKADAATESTDPDSIRSVRVAMTVADPEQVVASLAVTSTIFLRESPPAELWELVPALQLIALSVNDKKSLFLENDCTIDAPDYDLFVNSSNSKAMVLRAGKKGAPCFITANAIDIVGGYQFKNGSATTPSPTTGAGAINDPLAQLAAPDATGDCDHVEFVLDDETATLYPGVYCDGIEVKDGAVATLEPGVYIIRGNGITVEEGATLRGTEVCLYLTDAPGYSFDAIEVKKSTIDLSAPTSGAMKHVVIFTDRNAPTGKKGTHKIEESTWKLEGVVYLSNQKLEIKKGSTGAGDADWTWIIADKISLKEGCTITLNGDLPATP